MRFLLATHPHALTAVLGVAYRTIAAHLTEKRFLPRNSRTANVRPVFVAAEQLSLNVMRNRSRWLRWQGGSPFKN